MYWYWWMDWFRKKWKKEDSLCKLAEVQIKIKKRVGIKAIS